MNYFIFKKKSKINKRSIHQFLFINLLKESDNLQCCPSLFVVLGEMERKVHLQCKAIVAILYLTEGEAYDVIPPQNHMFHLPEKFELWTHTQKREK